MLANTKVISVIIPVYNVEAYIRRCVDSILGQTYTNLEIILVDDGSTDSSPEICDEYAQLDSRVKVIHKENGGVSSARNYGLKESSGEYLTFVDSDDYLESTCFEKMYRGMEENDVDMVVVGWKDQNDKEGFINKYINRECCRVFEQNELPSLIFFATVWGHLFRRKDVISNFFDENIFYGEDTLFAIKAFFGKPGKRIFVIGAPLYIYKQDREDSALNLPFNEKMFSKINALNQILDCVRLYANSLDFAKKSRKSEFFELYLKILDTNNKKKFKSEYKYLKRELILLRKEGYKSLCFKEDFVEVLYLYCYQLVRCYLLIKEKIGK